MYSVVKRLRDELKKVDGNRPAAPDMVVWITTHQMRPIVLADSEVALGNLVTSVQTAIKNAAIKRQTWYIYRAEARADNADGNTSYREERSTPVIRFTEFVQRKN